MSLSELLPAWTDTPKWGPDEDDNPENDHLKELPFAPFSKRDPINFVCDWYSNKDPKQRREKVGEGEATLGDFGFEDSEGFKIQQTAKYEKSKRWRDNTKERQKVFEAVTRKANREAQKLRDAPTTTSKLAKQRMKNRKKRYIENPRPATVSIKTNETWSDAKSIWMNNLLDAKVLLTKEPETLCRAGVLHMAENQWNKVTCTSTYPLKHEKFGDTFAHYEGDSTIKDPILMELAANKTGNVYATDTVLALLMNAPRSKYSWDIVIHKIGDTLFLDQRPFANSLLSVDETSQYRPTKKVANQANSWQQLAKEATRINYTFSQQIVDHIGNKMALDRPHPHQSENNKTENIAAAAFLYRKFELPDIQLVARCTVHGYKEGNKNEFLNIYSLNQYDPSLSKTYDWSKDMGNKESSIIMTELRNNGFKCARWATSAILAGNQTMKIGFVVRQNKTNPEKHNIVGVKDFIPKQMFLQLGLRQSQQWGILSEMVKEFRSLEDGRYCMIRDPLKQVMRIYSVTDSEFSELPHLNVVRKTLSSTAGN